MKLLNFGCGQRFHPDWLNVDFHSTGPDVMAYDLNKSLPFADNSFDVVYHSHLLEHFPKRHAPVFLKECNRLLRPKGIMRVVVPDLEKIARLYLSLVQKALEGNEEAQRHYEWIMLEMFDQMVRNCSGGEMLHYWKQNPMPAENFVVERVGSEVLNMMAVLRSEPKGNSSSQPEMNLNLCEETDPERIGSFRLSGEVHQWMYDRYSLKVLLEDAGFENVRQCSANESAIPDFNKYLLDIETDGSVRKPDSLFMEAAKP